MRVGTISFYDSIELPGTDKFVYSLLAFHVKPGKKFPRKVKKLKVGYFESYELVVGYLNEYCLQGKRGKVWDKSLHHFEVEKLPLNSELRSPLGYWIYLRNGSLFQAYPDIEAPFLGIKERDRKFQEKEIVELMTSDKLELAIIASVPRTPEEIDQRKRRSVEKYNLSYENDFTDYFFYTICYKNGVTAENIIATNNEYLYDYTHGLNIFPLGSSLSSEQENTLEDLYHLYHNLADK
jgi:hypothetical protein